jgi:sortase A
LGGEQTLVRVGVISMYVAVVFTLVAAAFILALRDEPRTAFATELASRDTEGNQASPAELLPEPPGAVPKPEPEPLPPEPPKVEPPKPEPWSEREPPEPASRPEPDPPQKAQPAPQQRSTPKPEPGAELEPEQQSKPAKPASPPETRRDARSHQAPESKSAPKVQKEPQEARVRPQQEAASAPTSRTQKGGGEAEKRPGGGEAKPPELPGGAVMTLSAGALGLHDVPVKSSSSGRALDGGVVHLPDTSLPWDSGEGGKNVYLAGHRLGWPGTGSHRVFYRLDELRKGDGIVLKDAHGREYRYRVTGSSVVRPGESWVKDPVPGRDMLTLQTCTPIPTFEKRLIVRANRV